MTAILDTLSGDAALRILKTLCAEDPALCDRIVALCKTEPILPDWDEIAGSVKFDLESIDLEDVWDRAGSHRMGYTSPDEAAWELMEEAMQPYADEISEYDRAGMGEAAFQTRKGVLKGLYIFEHESESEFKTNAPDSAGALFGQTLDDWRKTRPGDAEQAEMKIFLAQECPTWSE